MPNAQFLGALEELRGQGMPQDRIDDLKRQYRSANSPMAPLNEAAATARQEADAGGRKSVMGGMFTKDAGATGMDAVRSMQPSLTAGLLGALQGGGQAIDAPMAAAQGLIPQGDMALEALGTAGAAMTGGGAAVAPRGSLRMGLALNEKDMFHGTPDVRGLRTAGAFDQMTEGTQRISDLDAWRRLGQQIDEVGPSTPEGIDLTIARSNLLEQQRVNKPVFATPDRQMAATYADDTRAFDYQNAEPAIVSMRSNPQRILDINAGGADFRGIDLDRVKKGFREAGIPDADIEDALNRYIVAPRSDGKLSTNDLSAVSQSLGFDAVDVANVRDAYNNNGRSTPGTVRMAFNSDQIDVGDMQMLANADTSGGLLATAASDALTPSQQMARRILDMRAAGRASEVTDDMMAQADPQVMFNETPLPMDVDSRDARRLAAGFNTGAFHGGRGGYDRLDPEMADGKTYDTGTWAADDPDISATYNGSVFDGTQATYPLRLRTQNYGVTDWENNAWGDGNQQARMLNPNEPRPQKFGDIYEDWQSWASTDNAARAANEQGLDGLRINNVVDIGPNIFSRANKTRPLPETGTSFSITNPTTARSDFARFDPEFAHLSNLSAANASPTAGALASIGEDDTEARKRDIVRKLMPSAQNIIRRQ